MIAAIAGIVLILIGVLSASAWIIHRRPDAEELLDKLGTFQGILGAAAVLWGGWYLLKAIGNFEDLTSAPLAWILWVTVSFVTLANGFLLAFGLAMSFVSDEDARQQLRGIYQRLAPWQSMLGLAAIIIGTASLLLKVL